MDEKKIYIGNLEYSVTEDEIKGVFKEEDISVKDVRIIYDKFSGKSKGFGFAEFETEELTQKAIEVLNDRELKGRKLKVNMAKRKEANGGGGGFNRKKFNGGGERSRDNNFKKKRY